MENSINQRQQRLQAFGAGVRSRVSSRLGDVWWAFMLRGVFAGALGICALVWPTLSLTILIRLIGIYCLVDGLAGLVGALRAADRGAYLLQALVSLVVGGVLLFWPGTSMRTLLMVFGAWALFTGVSQILAVRQAEAEDARSPMTVLVS
jgi:uncharacterized membrane protein HdeD (DUF308 family)